jgi:predicted AlkP superfamily pyrophosphatase or phosphodiesterase
MSHEDRAGRQDNLSLLRRLRDHGASTMKPRPIIFLLCAVLAAGFLPANSASSPVVPRSAGPLILISIDGFRWDYLQKHAAPVLQQLAAEGVRARRMTSCFPSLTFPNHYTIVTGLRPEHHGIVANTFYDPALQAKFISKSPECSTDPRWWAGGEPVWITAEKQGVRSACFFWPGSEAENHGRHPSLSKPFDKSLTCAERVDGLLAWLGLPPEQRPRFCTLYFDIVDTNGHVFGPDAPETAAAIAEVDKAVGRLLDGLARLGLREKTDLVLVSDHGMEPVSPDQTILLDDYVVLNSIEIDFAGPNAGLRPKTGTAGELAAKFRGKHPQLSAWLRDEVPEHLHYRASGRIAPVVLSAAPGWYIMTRDFLRLRRLTLERGAHGYDPASPNMGALFIARGPSFQRGRVIDEVENIHVYNLLCATLGLQPAPNDGDDRLARETLAR